ncbi:hypothetical protein SY94_3266 [Agrobacterium tumefaciens]|nr:hypothetical protein SY94_3266 [Agrobacterium tumefaciens]
MLNRPEKSGSGAIFKFPDGISIVALQYSVIVIISLIAASR